MESDAPQILIVDDEPSVGVALRLSIQRTYRVRVEQEYAAALRALVEGRFDAVICDLMLGHRSGLDLHREVAQRRPELARRFVFVTGGAIGAELGAALEATGCAVLAKPFETRVLRAQLERVLSVEASG